MGCWDEYCVICGSTVSSINSYRQLLKLTQLKNTKYNWLDKLVIITNRETVIKTDASTYTTEGAYRINKIVYHVTPLNWHLVSDVGKKNPIVDNYGVVCHEDCYNLLHDNLDYKLQFSNVCRLLSIDNCLLKKKSIYREMAKYIGQDFEIEQVLNKNEWLLESPLTNEQNKKRILDAWKPLVLKFKKNPPRSSPCESATNFKAGSILYGYDGNKWTINVSNGKHMWIRLSREAAELYSKVNKKTRYGSRKSTTSKKTRGGSKKLTKSKKRVSLKSSINKPKRHRRKVSRK